MIFTLIFFQNQISNSFILWIVGQNDATQKKDVNQLDTGLTALPCPITTPINLTFKFQIKACNKFISIIPGPIDMAQAS